MITKITCRYSFEVLDFHCNDFGFTFNIGVSYLGIYKTSMTASCLFSGLSHELLTVMTELVHVFESASRGYHYYKNTWVPQVNQELRSMHQPENAFDVFAIALLVPADENAVVIGHLPREISRATKFLMDRARNLRLKCHLRDTADPL